MIRHIKLIEIVSQYGKIEVNELSKLLGISQVTTDISKKI